MEWRWHSPLSAGEGERPFTRGMSATASKRLASLLDCACIHFGVTAVKRLRADRRRSQRIPLAVR